MYIWSNFDEEIQRIELKKAPIKEKTTDIVCMLFGLTLIHNNDSNADIYYTNTHIGKQNTEEGLLLKKELNEYNEELRIYDEEIYKYNNMCMIRRFSILLICISILSLFK
jgi:hypothetical protein